MVDGPRRFKRKLRLDQHGETKRAIDSSEDLDSVSSLPDDILQHILSFTPTKYAIRSAILSKRWRHLWFHTPSLYFPYWYSLRVKADSINKTLTCYKALNMMNFYLYSGDLNHLPYIDGWIKFVMSRNVENLSLDLDFSGDKRYKIPEFFYINSSVKQLRVGLSFYDMVPKCSVSWTSLKKLYLDCCKLSDESLAKILSGCPILESLSLYLGQGVRVLDLSKSLSLRVLVIDRNIWVPGPTEIVAPHIHCLKLINCQLPCTLVDVSSLTEAKLDICFCSLEDLEADFLQAMVLKMLEKLQNVDKLTFEANFLTILSLAELRRVHFPSFKVKVLTFETKISQYVIPGTVRVLQNSPELNKLTVKTDDGSIGEGHIDKYLRLHGLNFAQFWSSEAMVFKDLSRWNVESKHVASFIELIFKTTKTLEKMVIRLEECDLQGRGFEELLEIVPMLAYNNNVSIVLSSTKPRDSFDSIPQF